MSLVARCRTAWRALRRRPAMPAPALTMPDSVDASARAAFDRLVADLGPGVEPCHRAEIELAILLAFRLEAQRADITPAEVAGLVELLTNLREATRIP